jgi:hypothetical protein
MSRFSEADSANFFEFCCFHEYLRDTVSITARHVAACNSDCRDTAEVMRKSDLVELKEVANKIKNTLPTTLVRFLIHSRTQHVSHSS